MDSILFLILRRMRAPLLMLTIVYMVATLGLTLIPGQDDAGNVWHMDFFHAFYFVTFTGTTIGFGEIPYPFTDAQRLWSVVFIYITVATWIYAIGSLINLLQNESLSRALREYQFTRQIRLIQEQFYLICGYGDTGTSLVRSLRRRSIQASVIDVRQERVDALMLDDFPTPLPGICANAANPEVLTMAGITDPYCRAVVALTDDNAVNLRIAIAARVMNPNLTVICRADARSVEDNMASFGTDHVIDPFNAFAGELALAMHSPYQYALNQWFRSARDEQLAPILEVPGGRWILCGYGRFGRVVYRALRAEGVAVRVIEPNAAIPDMPDDVIIGDGTGDRALIAAGVEAAVGIIAGSDDDSNNLSILVTARQLNPELFVVIRQNESSNRELFRQSKADIVMEGSDVLSRKIRTLLTSPMTEDFLHLARAHDDQWAHRLADQLRAISPEVLPHVWSATIGHRDAHAVITAISEGEVVTINDLIRDHHDRDALLPMMVLMLENSRGAFCMPEPDTVLHIGDRLLFAGTAASHFRMQWNLQNEIALTRVRTGQSRPRTMIGRWLERKWSPVKPQQS
jgi:voltage-gated potassium channel